MPTPHVITATLSAHAAEPGAAAFVALREIEVPAPTPASTATTGMQGMQGQGAATGTQGTTDNTTAPADHSGEQWVHLVPAGTTTGRDGRGPYQLDAQAVTAAFSQHGADLPVDYEHQSLGAVAKSGPVPAAGWITAVEPRADGLWGRVAWTAQASQLLRDRAYRYLSAVFDHLPDGRVIKLRGAGLVHSPNLPIQAAASQVVAGAGASISSTNPATAVTAAQGQTMNIEEMLERLRYMLNLPTLTDAAGVLAELDKLKVKLGTAESTVAAQSQQLAELQTAVTAAQAAQTAAQASATPNPAQWVPMGQYQAVTAQLAAMQATQATSAVETAVTAAMSAGKVAPAQKDWATAYASQDLKGFEAFVAASPVIVSAQAQAVPPQGAITAAQGALSETDREVAKLLDVSAQAFALAKAPA